MSVKLVSGNSYKQQGAFKRALRQRWSRGRKQAFPRRRVFVANGEAVSERGTGDGAEWLALTEQKLFHIVLSGLCVNLTDARVIRAKSLG